MENKTSYMYDVEEYLKLQEGAFDEKWQKEVTIKLKRWQIPILLGAARLGIWLQDWCNNFVICKTGNCNTCAGRWILTVGKIIGIIKKETDMNTENKGEGQNIDILKELQHWVYQRCEEFDKGEHQWIQQVDEATFKEIFSDGKNPIPISITDEMKQKAKNLTDATIAEKI